MLKNAFVVGMGPAQFVPCDSDPVWHWAKNAVSTSSNSENRGSGSNRVGGQRPRNERFEGSLPQAVFQLSRVRWICGVAGLATLGGSPAAAKPDRTAASSNAASNSAGTGDKRIKPSENLSATDPIRCQRELGDMLNYYYPEAA